MARARRSIRSKAPQRALQDTQETCAAARSTDTLDHTVLREHGYRRHLRELQIELVKFQRDLIKRGDRVLVLLEGRDAAGKDGVIKHIIEHLSPRDTRVVALPAPSHQQQTEWYFQRYVAHLPAAGEFVLFNRSWYNRAGVERVLGFCTKDLADRFLEDSPIFERMLVHSGIRLFKYYLDIDRAEQVKRLKERRHDPLSKWKTSPVDKVALKHWSDYSRARDEMLLGTHSEHAPWYIVCANDKHSARLNLIRHFLAQLHYKGKERTLLAFDPAIVFAFDEARLKDGSLAR
jgi:polyphosphate kinase 2